MKLVDVRKVHIHEAQPEKGDTLLDEYFNERALRIYLQTATLGFVTGIRSMSSLALLGLTSDTNSKATQVSIKWLPLFAVLGEALADKLPFIPSRTRPGPLIGRLVIGGISGYILCRRKQAPAIPAVIAAVVGAGTGAFASTYGRTRLAKITKIPDPVLGILEDALVSGLGIFVVGRDR